MFEVMMGDPRSWGEQPELFERTLAEQGAQALPDPELKFPDWLTDLRSLWGSPSKDSDESPT